jgi:hypothetical protein
VGNRDGDYGGDWYCLFIQGYRISLFSVLTVTFRRYLLLLAGIGGGLLLGIVGVNVIIDPFGFNQSRLFEFPRRQISYPVSPDVYKSSRFRHSTADTVLVGDSTMDQFDRELLESPEAITLENLSVPGQSLFDSIDTAYFASRGAAVERVIMGVPFRHFDDGQVKRVFLANSAVARNFFTLNSSATTFRASLYGLAHLAGGVELGAQGPPVPRAEFWDYQLAAIKTQLDARRPATQLKVALLEAVCSLRESGVEVVIFVPPMYRQLREMVLSRYGQSYYAYKAWLPALGVVLDYDIDSPLTRDRAKFKDHVHLTPTAAREVLRDALSTTPQWAQRIAASFSACR